MPSLVRKKKKVTYENTEALRLTATLSQNHESTYGDLNKGFLHISGPARFSYNS